MSFSTADLIERAAARLSFAPPAVGRPRDPAVPPVIECEPEPGQPEAGDFHRLERDGTIDWSASRTPIMEEIRLIKRRLLSHVLEPGHVDSGVSRLIMITSARPGEGKTFSSTNLALSIALEEDRNVVLVDADIHRQALRRSLGIGQTRGFVDVLADPTFALTDVMLRTDIPRLTILPAGTVDERAPELLAGSRMRGLMESLSGRFPDRVIIFDASPCLVSSDAAALASHVGQTVLIVEANRTQQHEVSAALHLLSPCPDISLVLNKARQGGPTSYGGYGAY